MENLLISWQEFLRGKRKRQDVAEFSAHFMDNILALHQELAGKTYRHGGYQAFKINDPKPRDIHKASVRDRLVHHALYRILYPYFDRQFIFDSYSCRIGKGTHRAINKFREYGRIVSHNHTRTVWVLKCDIRKFFASIDHKILKDILVKHVEEEDVLRLLSWVVDSFNAEGKTGVGLPLGNLTSQLLVNIYMNELDQFIKRKLKAKYYIRYADDFVIFSENREWLEKQISVVADFLSHELKLQLHPEKVFIKSLSSGVDFLGWVNFSHHRVLRSSTKWRMYKKLEADGGIGTMASYLGLLSHGNAYKLICRAQNFKP
ncbi:reverse transcriptase/maturase family protein [Patescibacteria group bacterium]|nr:reverse transcriptase/maturase family protein [Patescibacteria group bacterium]MBU2265173.1 reverse transcriptase/maturase family protein [Patescibacteria group bacterium]